MAGEDPTYITWIKAKPCERCGWHAGCEAHHIRVEGLGMRAHDLETIPLCKSCHGQRTRFVGWWTPRTGVWETADIYAWEEGKAAHYNRLFDLEQMRGFPA